MDEAASVVESTGSDNVLQAQAESENEDALSFCNELHLHVADKHAEHHLQAPGVQEPLLDADVFPEDIKKEALNCLEKLKTEMSVSNCRLMILKPMDTTAHITI